MASAHVVTKVVVVEEIATSAEHDGRQRTAASRRHLGAPSRRHRRVRVAASCSTAASRGGGRAAARLPAAGAPAAAPAASRAWGIPLAVLGGLLLVFVAVATWLPSDRYGVAPGEAQAVAPRLDSRAETFESDGELLFVTVSVPKLSVLGRLVGTIDPDVSVKTARELFGDQTREENRAENLKLMGYSKEIAAYVALKRLGYDVGLAGGGPVIESLCLEYEDESDPSSACVRPAPADEVLNPGDAIVALDGEPVVLADDIGPLLEGKSPGDQVTLTIYPKGAEESEEVPVTLTSSTDGRTIIGFVPIDGAVHDDVRYELPVTATITSDQIGGPSAGLAFTLTLLDELTPGRSHGREDASPPPAPSTSTDRSGTSADCARRPSPSRTWGRTTSSCRPIRSRRPSWRPKGAHSRSSACTRSTRR